MKIHEYQAKEILRKFKVAVLEGKVAYSVEEAVEIAKSIKGKVKVVKAQIHAGGRGKGARSAQLIVQAPPGGPAGLCLPLRKPALAA